MATDTPRISIVVPVYNTAEYLVRCLESIRKQTFQNYEVLIVNDGSTDNSERICNDFIATDARFRLINKQNGGLSSARLCGWKEAIGKYIVFIDSDDYIEPDYCKDLYEACEDTKSHLAICSYKVIPLNGTAHAVGLPFHNNLITDIHNEYIKPIMSYVPGTGRRVPGFLWLRMMRRDIITEACFVNENKVFAEDIVFDIIYAGRINRIVVVQRPLYNYCLSQGSLTRKYRKGLWQMYQNLYEACRTSCEKYQVCDVQQYLLQLLLGGALHSIQQAAACLDYKDFKADLKNVRNDRKMHEVINYFGLLTNRFKQLLIGQKVFCYLIRFIPSYVIYRLYRWRQLR